MKDYVELHLHTAFSFLDGASLPEEIIGQATDLGYQALAITDHDGLHGAMEFARAARAAGITPITGAELTLTDGSHLTLLAETVTGYSNLSRLITAAYAGPNILAESGPASFSPPRAVWKKDEERRPRLDPLLLAEHAQGLILLTGCRRGALSRLVDDGRWSDAHHLLDRYVEWFGSANVTVELQHNLVFGDTHRVAALSRLATDAGLRTVATGNVHYHRQERRRLQDVLVAIRHRTTLDGCHRERLANAEFFLRSPEEMAARFASHPEAVRNTRVLAERCASFDLTRDLAYLFPRYPTPPGQTPDDLLAGICHDEVHRRYDVKDWPTAEERLEQELQLIARHGLSGFFLLYRDLLELAREVAVEVRGPDTARSLLPPGRGRGSSVSSIVCHLTGLSHIDPVENELFLGRFLNEDLSALPDIDLDFPRDIRDVLIPRVHERYGHDRSALVAAFATYQVRSAVRDFGKALGLPPGEIERAARAADPFGAHDVERYLSDAIGRRRADSPRWRALVRLVHDAWGLPRHVTQHPGGMVISTQPLDEICPIQPAAMTGRQMVQWDKDSCADAGFLKIDLLGLGMLSAVERCVDEIARVREERIDLSRIRFDDERVYEEIQAAETMGVFQIESRAQMQMLGRTRPESLDDLTVQVALVRPGPIQGGAVHPYIERRKALRADPSYRVPYEHPSLEAVLSDTLGAIVFQDQVIEVAMAFAGFTSGEAEGLRRAMSRNRSEAAMRSYERKFVEGAIERGASPAVARRVYGQIVGFSGFGFPKAHSAAFGLLAYQSTWLRVHYGPEFLCALLNEQPMGFYPPDSLVHEAQRRGIPVLPPCVLSSGAECGVEGRPPDLAVRVGLSYVAGVGEEDVRAVVEERERSGGFGSLAELVGRCGAQRDALERLAWAGALDELVEGGRRQALWMLGVSAPGTTVPGGTQLALPLDPGAAPALRGLSPWERLLADYGSTKVTLREHPMELMRPDLDAGVASSADLERAPHGARVRVAGMVVARQRPATAKGVTFMLLEDEHGTINLIVPPPVYESCRLTVRAEPIVVAGGRLERREGVVNVVVREVHRLERPDLPLGEIRHIEPRRVWSTDEDVGNLRSVLPAAHSFGRRG